MKHTNANTPTQTHQRKHFLSSFALLVCAVLLLTTALLKFYGSRVSAIPQVGLLLSPGLRSFVIGWELLLGLWLLSRRVTALAWLFTLATFAAFSLASLYFGWIGLGSCGCFGDVKVSPWTVFTLDITLVIGLILLRPELNFNGSYRFLQQVGIIGLGSGAMISVLFLFAVSFFGSMEGALATIRGEALSFPRLVDFGTVKPGETVERSIAFVNHSKEPVRLVGGTADCTCIATEKLPATIEGNQSHEITIRILIPDKEDGLISRYAEVLSDQNRQRTMRIYLTAMVDKR